MHKSEQINVIPKGLHCAAPILGKSIVCPGSRTFVPGKNFKLLGFGVSWVWINIVRQGQILVKTWLLTAFLCSNTGVERALKSFALLNLKFRDNYCISISLRYGMILFCKVRRHHYLTTTVALSRPHWFRDFNTRNEFRNIFPTI